MLVFAGVFEKSCLKSYIKFIKKSFEFPIWQTLNSNPNKVLLAVYQKNVKFQVSGMATFLGFNDLFHNILQINFYLY